MFVLVLAAGVILLSSAALAAHSGSSGSISWTLDDSGKLTISGSGEMSYYDATNGWLKYSSEIKTVVISSGVTNIGAGAFFECENLTEISVPASVADIVSTEYDGPPFMYCPKLQAINVNSGSQYFASVSGVLFNKSKSTLLFHPPGRTATSYSIPDTVTKIGECAFYRSDNLESITIPSSVTYIDSAAFCDCGSLTGIMVPDSVTRLGAAAFQGCYSLTSVTLPNSLTSIEDYLFASCDNLTSVTLPDTVTSIGDSAFFWCESLESITIPNTVTSIGECAFCGCTGFTGITIPGSVTSIGKMAFANCYNMTDSKGFVIVRNVLYGYFGTESDITIPSTVTSISEEAFMDHPETQTKVVNVTVPASVTEIGTVAFIFCYRLNSVTIYNRNAFFDGNIINNCPTETMTIYGWPGSTTETYAANQNIAFQPLDAPDPDFFLPASLTAIPKEAFARTNARAVVIPKSVTSISGNPFAGSGLQAVYGYNDSAAKTFADKYGYYFVTIDDAWMASHGK